MDNIHLWELTQTTYRAIARIYDPILTKFKADTGLDGWTTDLLIAALTFDPEPITATCLQVRGPYTAVSAYQSKLAAAAHKGFLEEVKPCAYRLTMQGYNQVVDLIKEIRTAIALADPLPLNDSQLLATLLEKLVHASLDTAPPPDKWSISLAYKLMPPASPPLPYAEQAISCLNGYRDDAHLAAWHPSDLSASALEVLTLLWQENVTSLEDVYQRLQTRGHPIWFYTSVFEELRQNKFMEGPDDAPALTEMGRTFRALVETDTDHFFFTPWACLDTTEKKALADLLNQLQEILPAG